jgi:chemotaxis protein methyltransferase WspC
MTTGMPHAIEELLKNEIGLDPTSVGPQLILRAVRERMRHLKLSDLAAYERTVKNSAEELQELVEEVVVAESWFFRDERPFQWLRGYVQQRLDGPTAQVPLRILSMPCAAGEEPYSIAIILSEEGLSAGQYRIDAIDASARRLAIARRGVYSKNAFRGSVLPLQSRYFRLHPEGYEIDPALQASVQFIQGSILDPRLLEDPQPYDLVFCRNLLIYLIPTARAALLALVDRVLAADGVLLIGHADRLQSTGAERGFVPTGDSDCFAYRRIASSKPAGPVDAHSPGSFRSIPNPGSLYPVHAMEILSQPETAATATKPVISTNTDNVVQNMDEPSLLLRQASELANQGRFSEAISLCQQHLQQNGVTATAYCLMGMICQASSDRHRAEDCFRKAVYLDPSHDEALLALALLAERRGDQRAAAGYRRRAERTAKAAWKRVN